MILFRRYEFFYIRLTPIFLLVVAVISLYKSRHFLRSSEESMTLQVLLTVLANSFLWKDEGTI